jgi:hypothetical protein
MANLASGNLLSFIRWAYLKKIAFEIVRQGVAVATLLLMVVNGGWAQEVDSTVLQVEAAAHKTQDGVTVTSSQAAAA